MERKNDEASLDLVQALKLVVVRYDGEDELVSLTNRTMFAIGEHISGVNGVPTVEVDYVEEREACTLAQVVYNGYWPGWDVLYPWLDRWYARWMEEERKREANVAFGMHKFDDAVTMVGVWTRTKADEWSMPVGLERDGPDEVVTFRVRFEPGTTAVAGYWVG